MLSLVVEWGSKLDLINCSQVLRRELGPKAHQGKELPYTYCYQNRTRRTTNQDGCGTIRNIRWVHYWWVIGG